MSAFGDCVAEKMHTCLPEDKTVEGDAHGPQVQSLGESEHYFRGLNTDFQRCYAGAKGMLKL